MLVARRSLAILDNAGAEVRSLAIEIDQPTQHGEEWEWFTPVRLVDESTGTSVEAFTIFGIDSMASLISAIFIASVRLQKHQNALRAEGLRLTWMGDEDLKLPGLLGWSPRAAAGLSPNEEADV